jgi:mono/diheme cytochrome c family protein
MPQDAQTRRGFRGYIVIKHWMVAVGGCTALLIAAASAASPQSSDVLSFGKGRSVPAGDIVAGQNVYNAVCWTCHDRDLNGYKGPPLTGPTFYKIWRGRRADELAELIRNQMPKDDPGWLTEKSAHDVVAYIVAYANRPETLAGGQAGK